MIHTPAQALAFVRKHGLVTMTRSATRPSFVEAVAGGPVKGSWWSHAKRKRIFNFAESVLDSGDVLSLKLEGGKVTFVHRRLWPALARVVTDPAWKRKAQAGIPPDARKLLQSVERLGSLRLASGGVKGRKELEGALLVHSGSVHIEKGSHATVLTSWRRVFDAGILARAGRLSIEEARTQLGL